MAEVAGLVVGGIGLAAISDQCIAIIKYVDSGTNTNDNYQDAVLMLTLLGGRLNRWERTLRDSPEVQMTEEERENAEHWLKQIWKRLEEAEKLGERYAVDQPAGATTTAAKRSLEKTHMLDKLKDRVLQRNDGLSLSKRARWALFDEDKMNALVDKLDKLVSNLEQIFPLQHDRRMQIARTDVAGLLDSESTAQLSQAMEALKIAAAKVDKDFDLAACSSSHAYRNIEVTGKAMVNAGDFYDKEWAKAGGPIGKGGKNSYNSIRISGDSNVNLGTMYGGKSVFEMRNT